MIYNILHSITSRLAVAMSNPYQGLSMSVQSHTIYIGLARVIQAAINTTAQMGSVLKTLQFNKAFGYVTETKKDYQNV